MAHWEPERVKSQLRAAAGSLGGLLATRDTGSRETRGQIVSLLLQNDVDNARIQTRRAMHDDGVADVYELLESYCGGLLDRLGELTATRLTPDSPIYESVCAIIYSAPRTDCVELRALRDNLLQHYGASFAVAIADQPHTCVPDSIVRALEDRIPTRQEIDDYLARIALASGLDWHPPLSSREKLMWLASLFDEASPHIINVPILRRVSAQGLVDDPPWVRPLAWRLMLNTLPADRTLWTEHNTQKRDEYYDLARRLLTRLQTLPAPASPLSTEDVALLSISRALPGLLPAPLSHPIVSPLNPFDSSAPEETRITTRDEVDRRAWMIANRHLISRPQPPAIQVNGDDKEIPLISLTAPPSSTSEASPSTPLLRLMYIYTCLHPSTPPSQLPNVLIPLYTTLAETTDETDLAHVEADSFWLLEEVSAEFGDLWTDEGCDRWRNTIAKRLTWVDPDLYAALELHGLNPALPHYTFRWLTPILASTLSLPAIRQVWDSLFSFPMTQAGVMPKIDFLADICTSMLVKQRTRILKLCPPGVPNAPDPEGMMQVIQLLQAYPVEQTGVDNILDFALHITMRRNAQMYTGPSGVSVPKPTMAQTLRDTVWRLGGSVTSSGTATPTDYATESEDDEPMPPPEHHRNGSTSSTGSLGSRLKESVLKSLNTGPLTPVPEISQDDADQTPSATTFSLSSSMWKSLTGSARTPTAPASNASETSASEVPSRLSSDSSATTVSSFWSYAEKLRDSDAAASLAKVGTNWRIKAVDAISSRTARPLKDTLPDGHGRAMSHGSWGRADGYGYDREDQQRNSYPQGRERDYGYGGGDYVPPPRPKFFSPSVTPPGATSPSMMSPRTDGGGELPSPDTQSRSASIQAALSALTGAAGAMVTPKAKKKTGPRPLLLNSSVLITPATGSAKPYSRDRSPAPGQSGDRWSHVRRGSDGLVSMPRGSRSSMGSSVASPIMPVRTTSPGPMESDGGRRVPLNRGRRMRGSVAASESDAESSFAGWTNLRGSGTNTGTQSQRSSVHDGLQLYDGNSQAPSQSQSDASPPRLPRSAKGWEMVSPPDNSPPSTSEPSPQQATPASALSLNGPVTVPPHLTMSAPSPISPGLAQSERAATLPTHVGVTLTDKPVPRPMSLVEDDTVHAEPDTLSDAGSGRTPSVRRSAAVPSRKRTSEELTQRAGTMPESGSSIKVATVPQVRRKKYLSHKATPSMQHVGVSEDGVLDPAAGGIARSGHVRKGSTMSLVSSQRRHARNDSNATARKSSLTSPQSASGTETSSPATAGAEADVEDVYDVYGDIMLAYEGKD
ncbi:regulator of Vps4 activity in the MVB pathway-domain-containing protein [Auriculariales sp. MPI-PUGE-AT-0066]|nr:regulator of Vps4 activity in the MVB pathway-domain-containing protein [Auriculariales sp. MPI-PUGE-AT-0066]